MKKVLVYTLHKAASMFIHRINSEISRYIGVGCCSINNENLQASIYANGWKSIIETNNQYMVYGPIRIGEALPNRPDAPHNHAIIVQTRDPRDVMTSMYFSVAYSHPKIEGRFDPSEEQRQQWIKEGIDKYVLEVLPTWKDRYEQVLHLLGTHPGCNLVKYEDMVLHFDRWLERYLASFRHLVPNGEMHLLFSHCLETFQSEFTILPEDVYRHKRKMLPGDHKEKLKPGTIATLDRELGTILDYFGYH